MSYLDAQHVAKGISLKTIQDVLGHNDPRSTEIYMSLAKDVVRQEMQITVPTLMLWGMKDAALTHRMARPSMGHVEEGNLIFFPDATHWVQHEAAEEVNHYLIDFLLDKISKQAIR